MGQPTLSDLHVNALMTNLSLMYAQEADNFIATRVFPMIPSDKMSDRYTIYSRADMNRNQMAKRAPGTQSKGIGYKVDTTPTYSCDVWSLHIDIDDQRRANADAVFNLDAEATKILTNQALISREIDWATSFFTGGVWTTTRTGVAAAPSAVQFLQWNDTNSNPISDVRTWKRQMQLLSGGFRFNKAVFTRDVFDTLIDHPDFVDRVKYGQTPGKPAKVVLDALAGLFELDEVLVLDAIYNTGQAGAGPDSGGTDINAGESNAFVATKSALFTYTPSAPGLMTPGAGYTFGWTGYFGAALNGTRMKSFYLPEIESTRVEIDAAYDHKCAGPDMGVWVASVIA